MKLVLLLPLFGLLSLSCSKVDLSTQLSSDNDPFGSLAGTANKSPAINTPSNTSNSLGVGTWVETAFPDATFFKSYPILGRKPSQTLPVATQAKIINHRGSYTKVELENGSVGFIPSSMLIEQAQQNTISEPIPPIPELTSEPAPPTEDEILRKIQERQQKAQSTAPSSTTPEPSVPTIPSSGGFIAPEPEVQGLGVPTTPINIERPSQASDPISDTINQDASLELRITQEFTR